MCIIKLGHSWNGELETKAVNVMGLDFDLAGALVLHSASTLEELNHVTVNLAVPLEVDGG